MNYSTNSDRNVIQLKYWGIAKCLVRLDLGTSRFEIREFSSAKAAESRPFSGFFVYERNSLRATYVINNAVWLQVGAATWNVAAQGFRIAWGRVAKCRNKVVISDLDTVRFMEEYPSASSDPINANDPTFDAIDEEQEDFWLWLSRYYADPKWRRGIVQQWTLASGT